MLSVLGATGDSDENCSCSSRALTVEYSEEIKKEG